MALIILNQTSLDRSYKVMINSKKVDVLMPNEELYLPPQEEPSKLKFPWVSYKPIDVVHDDRITLTDHPIGAKLRNPWILGLFNASVILIPNWTKASIEQFPNDEAYMRYSYYHHLGIGLCFFIIFFTLHYYFPPFNIKKE